MNTLATTTASPLALSLAAVTTLAREGFGPELPQVLHLLARGRLYFGVHRGTSTVVAVDATDATGAADACHRRHAPTGAVAPWTVAPASALTLPLPGGTVVALRRGEVPAGSPLPRLRGEARGRDVGTPGGRFALHGELLAALGLNPLAHPTRLWLDPASAGADAEADRVAFTLVV